MAAIKKYNGSTFIDAAIRNYSTASEIIVPPTTIYSDGTAITSYTIKGNTTQSGTPTPSNPVDVQGVGVRTAQLFDFDTWANNVYIVRGTKVVSGNSITITSTAATCFTGWSNTEYPAAARIPVTEGETIQLTWDTDADDGSAVWIFPNASATGEVHTAARNKSLDYTVASGVDYITFRLDVATANKTITYSNIMFSSGSTAKPYEPWGYKIPISTAYGTSNIYLNELLYKIGDYADEYNAETSQYSRIIDKYVLTGEETVEMMGGQAPIRISGIYFKRPAYTDTLWLCTHYQAVPNSASWGSYDYCLTVSTNDTPDKYVRIRDINYNSGTAADYKAYLAQQYANGTPVTIYVVRLSAVISQITPVSIPTTEGANSITVDTTVQPSEFSATWTGWHDSSVKEYDGSDWQ